MKPTTPANGNAAADYHPGQIARFTLPLGRQDIELSETDFEAGGMDMLRIRIREGKRFTIFDVDPVSAAAWGRAMIEWSERAIESEKSRQANRAESEE